MIDACALQTDIDSLPQKDETLVGENGTELGTEQLHRYVIWLVSLKWCCKGHCVVVVGVLKVL